MRPRSLVCLIAIGLPVACNKEDREPDRVRSASLEPADPDEAPFHVLALELVDAGEAPRQPLRYRPAPERAVRASSKASVTRADNPPAAITTALDLSIRAAAGGARVDIVGLAPHVRGARASAVVDDRGRLQSIASPASLGARRELAAMLVRYLVPLPAEPVGPGASWRVKYALGRGGVYVAQTITYTLVRRRAGALELELVLEDSAEPQPIIEDGAAAGSLIALRSSGRGAVAIGLDQMVVSTGRLALETTFHARSPAGAEVFNETRSEIAIEVR